MSTETSTDKPDSKSLDSYVEPSIVNLWIGRLLLLIASVLICLFFIDYTSETGLPFPAVWFKMKPFFFVATIASFIASWLLMKPEPHTSANTNATPPVFQTINFYTRPGCHLCEEAYLLLSRYQELLPEIKVINIENDPDLVNKFTTCVPVVEIDGKVRFRGKVNEVLLQRQIDAALQMRNENSGS